MSEEIELSQQEQEQQMAAIMEQLQNSFDPLDYMTASQKEIARLSEDELAAEYLQVQVKTSSRSRMQRDCIVTRYEFELQKKQSQDVTDLKEDNNE
jgi:hypothetical protein|tara:strand:- start:935 stop:1222 length:288 start_codon:yes stop_codon:yes gene_type:complete